MTYLLILLFFLCLSFLLQKKLHIVLYRSNSQRFLIPLLFFIIGIAWDIYGVISGHWSYNYNNLLGIRLGILPIEELLFYLVIPYSVLVFYFAITKIIKK